MKALVLEASRNIAVKEVPDARIERPTDVLLRIVRTNICGSDLHMYDGRTELKPGTVLGHENLGQVIEIGAAVERIRVGDLVCVPFNVACSFCRNCERGFTQACLTTNPKPAEAGAGYGYAGLGPYPGGQAQLLRVPYGDFNCLKLPPDARDKLDDYVMLSDIFPTGYHATELANVQPGDSVVIYGAGPVGLMAAHSAMLKSACMVMVVDRHRDRLQLAEQIGAIAVDDSKTDPVEQVLKLTNGRGADRGCECVGFQAHDPQGHENPNLTLNNLVRSVRATGTLGVVGVFVPMDPGAPDDRAKHGEIEFDYGLFWHKNQTMGTGQCPVKRYNRNLRDLIFAGKATPSWIVSHRLPLEQGPDAYRHFDARDMGWTKVVLTPNGVG